MRIASIILASFLSFFIIVSGTILLPVVAGLSSEWFTFFYALSIAISASYVLAREFVYEEKQQ